MVPPDDPRLQRLRANLAALRARVDAARARGQAAAGQVDLLVVSKSAPTAWYPFLAAAGVTEVAENRVQLVEERRPLGPAGWRWHLVGHLQRNKAVRAVALFEVFHALDSVALAQQIARVRAGNPRPWPVYIQVNAAHDPAKGGIDPSEVRTVVKALADIPQIEPLGFMTLGRLGAGESEARAAFRTLREVRDDCQREAWLRAPAPGLSMGMSDDFEWAVEEGATVVRVGSAVFDGLAGLDAGSRQPGAPA